MPSPLLAEPRGVDGRLDLDSMASYLVSSQLVDPRAIIEGRLSIEDRCRRNRSFKVRVAEGEGLLVKQADTLIDATTARTVRVEADVLRAIAEEPALAQLRPFVPSFVHFDPPRSVCVTDLVDPATTLARYQAGGGRPPAFGEEAGRAGAILLATVHEQGGKALAEGALPTVPRGSHYMLTHASKIRSLASESPALAALARHVRERATWATEASAIHALWQGKSDLVHGDARWENFLLGTREPAGRMPLDMRLIDWELAIEGDGAFDVATWFVEYFRFWAHVVRPSRLVDLEDLIARSPVGPTRWHPQARAFWHCYARRRGLEGVAKRRALARAVRYLPPLLVIVATEACKGQLDLPGSSRALVDLSQRFHDDPTGSAAAFLGLRVSGEAG